MTNAPNLAFFDEYAQWLRLRGLAKNTINGYTKLLALIPDDVDLYFANPHLKSKKSKVCAYRSYLQFLCRKKKLLSRGDLLDALDTFKPPKRITNGYSERKWSVPKKQWEDYILNAPNKLSKMGIWLGFQFGLRLGEILHLRIQDIDFQNKEILIRVHSKKKHQEAWNPKFNRERQIPFTSEQGRIIQKWIDELKPQLHHPYLLWTPKGKYENQRLSARMFQRWCRQVGERLGTPKNFHPHILRYSFATHYYEVSKDVKLVGDLLGHANVSTTSEYLQLGKIRTMDKARKLFKIT